MDKSRKVSDVVSKKQPVKPAQKSNQEQRGPAPLDPGMLPQVGGGYKAPRNGW